MEKAFCWIRHPVTLLILALGLCLTPSAFGADTDADKSAIDRFIQYTMEATGGKDREGQIFEDKAPGGE